MGTIWYGGKIYTMLNEGETVEALYVENGFVKDVGSYNNLIKKYSSTIDEKINLQGEVMFPGFTDSHMHLIGHGEKLLRLDLSTFLSPEELLSALKYKVQKTSPNDWVFGEGWNENNFTNRKIFNRGELDEIAPINPMVLSRICRHAILVNSKALSLANITKDTPNPEGGVIVKDGNGEPTGLLLDQAQELVKNIIPKSTQTYLYKALQTSIKDCLSKGLVGSHSEDLAYYGSFHDTYETFKQVIEQDGLHYRVNLLVHHEVVDDMQQEGYRYKESTAFITFGAMKIFADGALGGRTALLSEPYKDAPKSSGVAIHSKEDLFRLVEKARNYHMPIAIHTIGDLAFEYALDAISMFPAPVGEKDRLIHAQILRKELIKRAKLLPVILDIQPRFVASDFPWILERLGEERMEYSYAWKTLLQEGFICAGGSDAPIEPVDPLLGIYAAVSRKAENDPTGKVYGEHEKLTMFEAISLFTKGSAQAVGNEKVQGFIAPGYYADFTVLEDDLFKVEEDQIPHVKVKRTVVNGEVMYEA
ncbi:amidohydrolase [Sutcliffiella cohnii]|uniref:Amidohydrolase n=1 Tax=Sutcliffiella cohnii TaxID=33932 RepID=A0A223KU36_9BACI|nr:amidohydrolase [Sutcliffiella cohnii]AST92858.1 amidohydrolase [Sutcliffiella cohnii]